MTGARKPSRLLALATLAAVLACALAGSGGCELIVSDKMAPFSCRPGPGTCPSGSICAPRTGQCVPLVAACTSAGCPRAGMACDPGTLLCEALDATAGAGDGAGTVGDGAATPGDAGGGGPATCRGLGCKCSGVSDCDSTICSDQLTVTPELFAAAGKASFCTKPCCTSADCDPATVCFGSGAGGNYCVRPDWLGRSPDTGAKLGGGTCGAGADCRSGICAAGACADTCCSATHATATCGGGTVCRFGAFPGVTFDTHDVAHCASPGGSGAGGTACQVPGDCQSGLCVGILPSRCRDACRSSPDCPAGQICGYTLVGSGGGADVVAGCTSAPGSGTEGTPCQGSGDCKTGFCSPTTHRCTAVCFADGDCTFQGWHCRPETVQFGGSYSVLACGS